MKETGGKIEDEGKTEGWMVGKTKEMGGWMDEV